MHHRYGIGVGQVVAGVDHQVGLESGQPRHPGDPLVVARGEVQVGDLQHPDRPRAVGQHRHLDPAQHVRVDLVQAARRPGTRPRRPRARAPSCRRTPATDMPSRLPLRTSAPKTTSGVDRGAKVGAGHRPGLGDLPHDRPDWTQGTAPHRPDHRHEGPRQGPRRHHPDGADSDQRGRGGRQAVAGADRPAGARRGDPGGQEAARGRGGVRAGRPSRAGREGAGRGRGAGRLPAAAADARARSPPWSPRRSPAPAPPSSV